MATITQARAAASKAFLGAGFAVLCVYGLDGLVRFSSCLFLAMLLFADMMREDAVFMTVDLRKAGVLGILLLLGSKEPLGNFLLTAAVSFLGFRLLYLAALLRYSSRQEALENAVGGRSRAMEPLGFLPSFGLALFLAAAYLSVHPEPQFLTDIREGLCLAGEIMAGVLWPWASIAILWGILEYLRCRLERRQKEMIEGFGMGDVIVLPMFAAFLGIALFGGVFFLALLIHLGHFFFRSIVFCSRRSD